MAGVAVRAHRFSGRLPQSPAGAHSVGMGVPHLRQGRPINHPQLPIGTSAARLIAGRNSSLRLLNLHPGPKLEHFTGLNCERRMLAFFMTVEPLSAEVAVPLIPRIPVPKNAQPSTVV